LAEPAACRQGRSSADLLDRDHQGQAGIISVPGCAL
jgi:hypothetical protein